MKIALIQTPRQDFYTTPQRHYPLGLTCLAGAVRDLPADCDILDFLSRGGRQTLSVPPNFAPASKFYREDHGPLSVFYQYYHFGLSW